MFVVEQGKFIIIHIVFQRFLHICEKLDCDMILVYGYPKDYVAVLLTEPGCILVLTMS